MSCLFLFLTSLEDEIKNLEAIKVILDYPGGSTGYNPMTNVTTIQREMEI